jgi:hypothetical protein
MGEAMENRGKTLVGRVKIDMDVIRDPQNPCPRNAAGWP